MSCRAALGTTSLMVTPLCIGGSAIGSMPQVFGEEVDFERGVETVRHVFDADYRFRWLVTGEAAGVPVFIPVLGNGDLNVLRPYPDFAQPGHEGAIKLSF